MKVPGLDGFLRMRARARLRNVMRGYRFLKKMGGLRRVAAVKEALTATPVFSQKRNSENFAGMSGDATEIAVRQFLLVRLVSTGLGAALLSSVGKRNAPVVYPLPSAWRKILGEHGFEVAERASAFLWACVVALHFASGIFVVLKFAVADARHLLRPANKELKRHVYFDALGLGNLPPVGGGGEKNDIVSWYLDWPGRAVALDRVCHNVATAGMRELDGTEVVPVASPLHSFSDWSSLARFLAGCIISIGKAFFRSLAGHWWHSMMLGETVKATHVRVQDPALLARDYLFHNSNWIYRPLWTYEAERRGSRILFYFYSTNTEQFKQSGIYPEPTYGWRVMTWSHYLVWDEYQAAFIRRAVDLIPEVTIVGPILFQSGSQISIQIPANAIAVFDVQPMRDAIYQSLALATEYYIPRQTNQFLIDIQETGDSFGKVMVLKRKRAIGNKLHPLYLSLVRKLQDKSNYIEIDPDTSATALIEKCAGVISAPFTSTALLGRELGKPSIYYDPHGACEKDDRAAHGIPILSGKKELQQWFAALSQ